MKKTEIRSIEEAVSVYEESSIIMLTKCLTPCEHFAKKYIISATNSFSTIEDKMNNNSFSWDTDKMNLY